MYVVWSTELCQRKQNKDFKCAISVSDLFVFLMCILKIVLAEVVVQNYHLGKGQKREVAFPFWKSKTKIGKRIIYKL